MTPKEIAPEVFLLTIGGFVNAYLVGNAQGWVLIDTGIAGHFEAIRDAAEQRFGVGARPGAILLTHGHMDHVGSALALAAYWDAPIYAHPMEAPYLTGKSSYPPGDPETGGFMGLMFRLAPNGNKGVDLGDYFRPLPADGVVPVIGAEWVWVPTPGHAPGQVAFWRERDRTLIAGDAVVLFDTVTLRRLIAQVPRVCGPPAPMTPDWYAARKSIARLADLKPAVLAAGHGQPIFGAAATAGLNEARLRARPPEHGRYVAEPAEFDEQGVRYVPPARPDRLPLVAGVAIAALAVGTVLWTANRKRRNDN